MKRPESNDEVLTRTLREWRVTDPLPPRFREQVWSRIEKSERTPSRVFWFDVLAYLERLFAVPKLAISYAVVLLALGLGTGYLAANAQEKRVSDELALRYVQSIDPYQKAK